MDGATTADPAVAQFFYLKYATSYATASAMALILHDFVTTFGQEVELVWRSPLTLPKLVYLTNRYTSLLIGYAYMTSMAPFLVIPSPPGVILNQLQTWYGWLSTVMVQLVLQVWLYALYSGYRSRLYWISAAYVLLAGLSCACIVPYISNVRFIAVQPVCAGVNAVFQTTSSMSAEISRLNTHKLPAYVLGILLAWGAFTAVLLGLLAARVCVVFRVRPSTQDGIAFILFRDATLYCVALLSLLLMNVLFVVLSPFALYEIGFGYAVALPSVLSSRILLNLRECEKSKAQRVDVHGLAVEQWETMFHIT